MAEDDLKAELERLKAENERLKMGHNRSMSLKVSEKGGVSVRPGAISGDALQGAMGEAARYGPGHPRVHQGKRGAVEIKRGARGRTPSRR